jgi:hypothetical protein
VFGYTYGSLLGVFLVGALTRTRGNDRGNLVAMVAGFVVVGAIGVRGYKLAFPWFVMVGTLVTGVVAIAFATPPAVRQRQARKK